MARDVPEKQSHEVLSGEYSFSSEFNFVGIFASFAGSKSG
jgi:hypothetical protein